MKEKLKEFSSYVLIILIVILVRTFIITPVRVYWTSMQPTMDDGNIVFLNKLGNKYNRFDIIVFDYNNDELVKRVIGLPGDQIKYENNKLYVNGKYVKEKFDHKVTYDYETEEVVPRDKYFVMGDNRTNSLDSRYIGFIDTKDIKGNITLSLWPLKKVK